MSQYRILKKINYRYNDNFYPEAYIIQVKKFMFWNNLKYWSGSDASDVNFWHTHLKKSDGSKRPKPYKETTDKFGSKCCEGGYGNQIFFKDENSAKFFLKKVLELDEYIHDCFNERKGKKEKAVDIIYIDDKRNERKPQIIML